MPKTAVMSLVLEIAAGIVLGLGIWRLPTDYRRLKLHGYYLTLSADELVAEAFKAHLYTKDQQELLMTIGVAAGSGDRKARQKANFGVG